MTKQTIAKIASIAIFLGSTAPAFATNGFFGMPLSTNNTQVSGNVVTVSGNTGNNTQNGVSTTGTTTGGSMGFSFFGKPSMPTTTVSNVGSNVGQIMSTGNAGATGQTQIMANISTSSFANNNATITGNNVTAGANSGFNVQNGNASTGVSALGGKSVSNLGSSVGQGMVTGNASALGTLWIVANAPATVVSGQ